MGVSKTPLPGSSPGGPANTISTLLPHKKCYIYIMAVNIQKYVFPLILFLSLFCITPFVSKYSGCVGGGPNFGCVLGVERQLVFPAYRTVICELYHKPGCTPNTLLPGSYDQLLNYENTLVLFLLILISIRISSRKTI